MICSDAELNWADANRAEIFNFTWTTFSGPMEADIDTDYLLKELELSTTSMSTATSVGGHVVEPDGHVPSLDVTEPGSFGSNAGTGGSPNIFSTDCDFDDLDTGLHLLLDTHLSHPMDLGDFNLFGDKCTSARRDDGSMPPSTGSAQGNSNTNNMNLDALQQLLSMQMQYPMSVDTASGSSQNGSSNSASASVLLEQQLRLQQLQQLQQLQNQIFQQQIELISGQSSLSNNLEASSLPNQAFRDSNQFQGLPTPANSTELRPQPAPNFVSPMILQNYFGQPGSGAQQFGTPQSLPHGPSSAPAHIAFSTQAPLMSPGDIDFDLSPITSPWLGAASYQQAIQQHNQQQSHAPAQTQIQPKRRGSKRGASSSGDDTTSIQTRKRQSTVIRAATGNVRKAPARGSVSVGSTPAFRAQSNVPGIADDIVGDTPSPVDLSMPPPSPPVQSVRSVPAADTRPQTSISSDSSSAGTTLSPVTPASIMNLGRLGISSGLSSPHTAPGEQEKEKEKAKAKDKAPPNPKTPSSGPTKQPLSKRASSTSLVSPSLKPLLPGGLAPSSAAQLGAASNYTHHLSGSAAALRIAPATPLPQPTPAVRKTSHKAAEQKRRDSLKTSFDDLRLLLPPLPLPSDDNYTGEMPLPGSLPPRGPPRGDVAGPNRAVSKLQLLRCGNDFIRRLQGRVARRDEYMEQLRREVRILRARVDAKSSAGDVDAVAIEMEKVDLERDIDAEEINAPRLGGAPMEGGEDVDEEDD